MLALPFVISLVHAVSGAQLHSPPKAPTVEVAPGVLLPVVALGTGSGQKGDVREATALWLGQTNGVGIDTAFAYFDEGDVANGIADAGAQRDDIFLETKIPCSTYATAVKNFASNLQQLQVDFVDLTLIHTLTCATGSVADTWRALTEALAANQTRAIGVSHFKQSDLEALAAGSEVRPAVNQCELSVSFHDDETMAYCRSVGITYQSYSPLCGGFNGSSCTMAGGKNVLTVPEVIAIAATHNVSPAQVGLKWIVQQGYPLTTAVWRLDYMDEDLDLWSWGNLTKDEMDTLSAVQG